MSIRCAGGFLVNVHGGVIVSLQGGDNAMELFLPPFFSIDKELRLPLVLEDIN